MLDRREDIQGPDGTGHSGVMTLSLSVPQAAEQIALPLSGKAAVVSGTLWGLKGRLGQPWEQVAHQQLLTLQTTSL